MRLVMLITTAWVSWRELPGGSVKLSSSTPSFGKGRKSMGTSISPVRLAGNRIVDRPRCCDCLQGGHVYYGDFVVARRRGIDPTNFWNCNDAMRAAESIENGNDLAFRVSKTTS